MPNRLAGEKSPYLLQHARNPVDWYPWGPAAFEKARAEDKPLLVSIGYATCHWCHVMERESFEDPAVAALMNRELVCVKVDREERPDVDRVHMTALQALTGQGGWPLNMFLTPEGKPFLGGTYFPPADRGGRPGWATLVHAPREPSASTGADATSASWAVSLPPPKRKTRPPYCSTPARSRGDGSGKPALHGPSCPFSSSTAVHVCAVVAAQPSVSPTMATQPPSTCRRWPIAIVA